jgi:hypothetical protein
VPEARPLDPLTAEDFRPHLGTGFRLASGPLGFELIEVTTLSQTRSPGVRAPFSLIFRAPSEPILQQGIQKLEHDEFGVVELFLVPLGPDEAGMRYEAVFT